MEQRVTHTRWVFYWLFCAVRIHWWNMRYIDARWKERCYYIKLMFFVLFMIIFIFYSSLLYFPFDSFPKTIRNIKNNKQKTTHLVGFVWKRIVRNDCRHSNEVRAFEFVNGNRSARIIFYIVLRDSWASHNWSSPKLNIILIMLNLLFCFRVLFSLAKCKTYWKTIADIVLSLGHVLSVLVELLLLFSFVLLIHIERPVKVRAQIASDHIR